MKSLLSKLNLTAILAFIARFAAGKNMLALLHKPAEYLKGWRTELILALQCLIWLLKAYGVLDTPELQNIAHSASLALLGALPQALADKAKRAQDLADGILK